MTGSSSGGEMSAWDIMQMMDSGRGDEAVEILSGGGNADPVAEERGTFEVILPASSMNLPEGGWVELEIAGDAYFKGTAFPGPDGNVRFTVPRQRIGAIITVSLTAYLPEGTPYINGSKTGPAEEDGGASFAVPLEDLPAIIIGFGGDGAANGNTAEQGGDSYEVMEYSSGVSLNILSSIADATLEIKVNGADAAASQTLSDGFNDISVVATMGGGKPPVTASKKVYAVKKLVKPVITQDGGTPNGKTATSGGKSYTVIEYETSLPTVTVTNSYDGDGAGTTASVFTVTHNGSTSSASMTLSDGFNAIVATLEKEHCVTQKDEKYYYVVKKLVVPVITMSGATPNGKTATSGGKTYTVIEYESTLPTVTITNSYNGSSASYEAKLGTTVLSTACPSTITNHTLSDGFNAVTAALSEPYCDTLKDEKYYYVIKALTKPTVTYSDGILTDEAADAGGYHMLRYSYLADPIVMAKFSVTNPYSDGSVTMTVKLDGTTLTGEATTGDISNRALTDGTHTIIITLSNDYCTEVSVTKKINVKMKAVKVQISGTIHGWYENGKPGDAPLLTQDFYIQAVNSSSAGEYADETGTRKTCASVQSQWATYNNTDANINTDSSNNYVYLTDPGSTFKFWTGQSNDDTQDPWWMGFVPENDSTTTRTLTQLKASSANRIFDSGDRNNAGNPASGGVRSRYWVTVTIADAAYTAGTDDEPPPSP